MTRDELIKTAIKTVIQYAEEQGVKLRRIDFKESEWIFVPDGAINYYTLPFGKDEEVNTVCVKISYHGRWEKQLKIAKERFLNYFNARLEENCLSFSFTAKELEIIAVGRVEGSNDEKIETIIKKINKLLASTSLLAENRLCSMATKRTLFPQDEYLFICSVLVTGWQTSTQRNTATNTVLQTVFTIAFAVDLWQG